MSTNLAKCSCSHCGGHLEFDTAYAGERVACPHCGMETLLSNPVTASEPPTPSPAPPPTNSAAPAAYRLADPTGSRTPAPRPTAAPSRTTPPRNPNPFARQAARASWISFIFAYGFSALARQPGGSDLNRYLMITVPLFLLIGFALGVIALFGVRRHGTKGILIPAVVGLILDGVYLGAILVAIVTGLNKRHELQATAASVSSSTQSVTTGKVPVEPSAKRPTRSGEPIVTLLEPGAEPRQVLRFQPKAGDKQTVAFTMKLAMDPSPLTNLPPVTETAQITIKKALPNGDIAYESTIKDVRVLAGSDATAQPMKDMGPAFSTVKGLITSGVVSSRGFNRGRESKNPKSGKQLPAVVRLFDGHLYMALDSIVLPEEAIGAGGKWEVRTAEESRVYEIVSIEGRRVTAKATITASGSEQASKDLAITGGGSGEMTVDLDHIMPAKGNLVNRLETSETDKPGGKNLTMKMQTDLHIEAK